MPISEDVVPGQSGHASHHNQLAVKANELDELVTSGRLSEDELNTTFVRFVDENGDPLPAGSITTIHVNTVTGEIDDITFEEA